MVGEMTEEVLRRSVLTGRRKWRIIVLPHICSVVNLSSCKQDNLRLLFGKFGVVESVTLHEEANMPSTTDAPSKYFNIGPDQVCLSTSHPHHAYHLAQ